jgi:hypothetical protein
MVHVVKGRQYRCLNRRDGVWDRLSALIVTSFDASATGMSSTAQYSFQTSDRSVVARRAMRAIYSARLAFNIEFYPRDYVSQENAWSSAIATDYIKKDRG